MKLQADLSVSKGNDPELHLAHSNPPATRPVEVMGAIPGRHEVVPRWEIES
jgi:hypothetical protein